MRKWTKWLLLLTVSTLAFAGELNGVKFPDGVQVGGKKLVLNGLGMRKATFLRVKVYVGALYLENKSKDAKQILDSPELKRVELAFVRDVDAGKIRDAWGESLEKNCSERCERFKAPLEELKSKMADMKDGDRMDFDIYPTKVDVWLKGKPVGSIAASDFPQQFLKSWLGNPPNDELKSGMLGR